MLSRKRPNVLCFSAALMGWVGILAFFENQGILFVILSSLEKGGVGICKFEGLGGSTQKLVRWGPVLGKG